MKFEMKLSHLFDYQRFEGNAGLQQMIDAVHAQYPARVLALDELEMIAAAGQAGEINRSKDKLT